MTTLELNHLSVNDLEYTIPFKIIIDIPDDIDDDTLESLRNGEALVAIAAYYNWKSAPIVSDDKFVYTCNTTVIRDDSGDTVICKLTKILDDDNA